jgi:hypothetical protein
MKNTTLVEKFQNLIEMDNYSLIFVIFIDWDWVGQVLFLVSCPKEQVEKYVNVEACTHMLKAPCRSKYL